MKKHLLSLIAISVVIVHFSSCAVVAGNTSSTTNAVSIAIKKYKAGNYTGCLQDCQSIVQADPSNSVAFYYMAMSYAQAGKKDEAIKSYSNVLSLKPNPRLADFASTGKRCLETPEKCQADPEDSSTEVDRFINSQGDVMSSTVKKEYTQKNLNNIKNEINADKEMDAYKLKKFVDYTNKRSQADDNEVVAQNKPTNDQIVAALKVLKDAGFDPYSQVSLPNGAMAQNQEMAQLQMLTGGSNPSSNNNSMATMLPFILAQNKNGAASNNYSPQMMQAVMMNSMLPNLNFDTEKDK